ncbi:MAG: hypothetical protein QM610_07870 [Chitinophagaceae bacterium]
MKKYKRSMIAFVVLLVLYVITKLTAPKPTQWNETLRDDDKNPYGTYILHKSLPTLFPNIKQEEIGVPLYNFLEEKKEGDNSTNQAYIAIAPRLSFTKVEIPKLLAFIKKGNYALLSAEYFNKEFADSLGFKTNALIFNILDSSRMNFTDSTIKTAKGYRFFSGTVDNYFDSFPKKYPVEKLGVIDQSQQVNFIKVSIGKGALLLHASPLCFSNAFILQKDNYHYTEEVLSYLPKNIGTINWDQYYTQGRNEAQTPFRYFLSHFWLRIGFCLAWILLILYALFGGKRRQRIIPIVNPPRNTTADFMNTISSLYYNQKSGNEIFEKKVYHWLAFIRNSLHLDTENVSSNDFWERLALKSNTDLNFLLVIRQQIISLQTQYNDDEFSRLYKNIENFYQQAKK